MAYFYEFELVLAGIILLTGMTYAGTRLWLKRKSDSLSSSATTENESDEQRI